MGRTSGRGLFFGLCGGLALALLAGCGSHESQPAEPAQVSKAEALAGPVTLSITSPAGVPPLSPVVSTRNSLYFGAAGTVVSGAAVALGISGGGIHTEPDAVLNDTWSRGLADLGDRTLVRGVLHAATHKYGNGLNPPPTLDASPAFEPLNNLTWTVRYPSTGTGAPIIANPPPSPPLPPLTPGQYGDVAVNSGGSLTIKSGTYYLRSLKFESNSTVTLDQADGPVILYVETDQLALRGAIKTVTNDPPDLAIIYLGTTAFSVETLFNGALVAPNTTATLRAVTGIHTGFFYAKDFQLLDAHARVQYRAPLPIVKAANPTGDSCAAMVRAMVPVANQPAAIARYCGKCAAPYDTDRDFTDDCLDGCPLDPAKTAPGVCGCGVSDTLDKDSDGFPNCIDRCSDDPNNIAPGQCGCVGSLNLQPNGTPCTDTSGPQANATCNSGVCGDPTIGRPATGCRRISFGSSTYWLCPPYDGSGGGGGSGGSGGAGGSGGRAGSGGAGGGGGRAGSGGTGGSGGTSGASAPLTESDAQLACSAKGLSLIRIDSMDENRRIQSLITQPIWLGANSITTANNWRWATAANNNGDQFWSGGVNGARVGGRFNNWAPGTLASTDRCVVMLPTTGRWSVVPCNQARGYICEYRVPPTRGAPISPPGGLGTPPTIPPGTQCVSEATAQLPDAGPNGVNAAAAQAQLKDALDKADGGVFTGPFVNPVDAGTCPDNPGADGITRGQTPDDVNAGCPYSTGGTLTQCLSNADCAARGPNFVCRSLNDSASCTPGSGATCRGHTYCVTVSCPQDDIPCDQIEVCNPDSPLVTPSIQDPSALNPKPLDPATLFAGNQLPNVNPSTATWGGPETDPAHGPGNDQFGTNNAWCKDSPRKPADASKGLPDTDGKTSTSSKIQFGFKPNLTFKANPSVLGQGETNLDIGASASLAATVKVENFLGQSFGPENIFNAEIGMGLQRCQIFADAKAQIFGQSFVSPKDLGLPWIDSRDPAADTGKALYDAAKDCDQAVGKFQLYADRTKKAFRDAQQLLTQYKTATGLGKALAGNLCNAVFLAGSVDEDFPGGPNCADDEPPYVTVGRLLDYYQAPGTGQLTALRDAQQQLADATSKLKNLVDPISLGFDGLARQESETVLSVQFWIGPIPVLLEIDVFAKYGIGGGFDLIFKVPTGLVATGQGPDTIAQVKATVAPYAAAGLSAFVGVGFSLGPLKASIGIEGSLTLASISAPIFAGVGLEVEARHDQRTIHSGILDVAAGPNAFPFGPPTAIKFGVNYTYGAGVDLAKILEGEVNGKLRIKFFFFSRTWRKNILRFSGLPPLHFDLVQGSNSISVFSSGETVPAHLPTADGKPNTAGTTTAVASGSTDTGLAETQAPLMVLAPPPLPPVAPSDPPSPVDLTQLERAGYDGLCCSPESGVCQTGYSGRPQCCPGLTCKPNTPGASAPADGTCQRQCNGSGTDCHAFGNNCCGGLICGTSGNCQQCGAPGKECGNDSDCCSSLTCDLVSNTCVAADPCAGKTCNNTNDPCLACGKTCCGGLVCRSDATCGACVGEDAHCGNNDDCCGGLRCSTTSFTCYDPGVPH